MRADTGIERAVKDGYTLEYLRNAIARVVGADHPHLTLLTDLVPAITLLRAAFTPEVLDPEAMTEELVSFIRAVGEHTAEVLRKLGLDDDAITALRQANAVR